jgi:hypothetical protein
MKLFNFFKKKREPLKPPKGSHLVTIRTSGGLVMTQSLRMPGGPDPRDIHVVVPDIRKEGSMRDSTVEIVRGVDDDEETTS